MRFSTLADWLGWLEQSHPKEIDLGLNRIRQVAVWLDLLAPQAKVVTVAGTNGKGSCVTATAGLLRAAHFSVGTYTSPHLLHYAERIQVNGEPVADQLICNAFDAIAQAAAEISLSYFEYGTLAALLIFKQQKVDFVVLEVGLGGRLDAVNIIDADVAVITSIAIDHQEWLGDTREQIGREKAGVLREQQLFVCADANPPESILELAAQLKTKTHFVGRDFSFSVQAASQSWQWHGKALNGNAVHLPLMKAPHLPLPSMAAALQVVHLLDVSLTPAQIESALLSVHLAGRFQKLVFQGTPFILDVAHNPAATQYLAQRLQADPVAGKTYALVAMMRDKDCLSSLTNLLGVVDEWYTLALEDVPRAASAAFLADTLASMNAPFKASGELAILIQQLLGQCQAQDRILIFGSFFTVAAALDYMQIDLHTLRGHS